jgi:phosphatidylglycerol:prolipoprotein diacylglycerol transferase
VSVGLPHAPTVVGAPCDAAPAQGFEQELTRGLQALSRLLDRLADRVVLFRWGGLVFVSFGLFAALGALVSTSGMAFLLIGQQMSPVLFGLFVLAGSVAMVLGSWLLGLAFDYRLLLERPREVLRRPVFVSWGGLFSLGLVIVAFAGLSGFSALLILDALGRCSPLGHALGRLGCLAYGCCFGHPTHGHLAITYRNPEAKAVRVAGLSGVRLHPAPFYEILLDLAIFAAVNGVALLGAPVGVPAALTALFYALGRFLVEFSRNNQGRMIWGPFSLNHAICLLMALASAVALRFAMQAALASPALSWPAVAAAAPTLLPVFVLGALLVFLGFSTHRGRVGGW